MNKIDFKFVDMHSHMMYKVDDGSKDKQTSEAMLKIAEENNIGTIILTPHYHPTKCPWDYEEVYKAYEEFQSFAKNIAPDMKFVLGREIYYRSDVLDDLEAEKKLTLGEYKYLLIEFDPYTDYNYVHTAVNNIIQMGYTPIIAHIERYQCVVSEWKRAIELSDMGAVIQVNAASVIGGAGTTIKKFIKKLMKNEIVDLVSTDAHSAGHRSPKMLECAQYIMKKYGYEYAKKVTCSNAELIINGDYLED